MMPVATGTVEEQVALRDEAGYEKSCPAFSVIHNRLDNIAIIIVEFSVEGGEHGQDVPA